VTRSRTAGTRRRTLLTGGAAAVLAVTLAVALPAAAKDNSATGVSAVSRQPLRFRGTVDLRSLASAHPAAANAAGSASRVEIRREPERSGAGQLQPAPAHPAPDAPNVPVRVAKGGSTSFVGLTGLQERLADNGNQFTSEPPDQGLCAGNGVIAESVNTALSIYTDSGQQLIPAVALNEFYGLGSEVDRSHNPPTFGSFTSDPRCYFDQQSQRWIHTLLEFGQDPYTGAFRGPSAELIAVSQTPDPTGGYSLFSIDTTNDGSDGTPRHPHCPCFGDQPRLGADANGLYISSDEFPINGNFNGNGAQLYAISLRKLVAATDAGASSGVSQTVPVTQVPLGGKINGLPLNALQPAQTAPGTNYPPNREYFLSTPDYTGSGATSVLLWTLSNTASLNANHPALTMSRSNVPSEPFSPPTKVAQRHGPIPLGASLNAAENGLQSNDDRMMQVAYSGGELYSGLNTGLGPNGKAKRTGSAWFRVTPTTNGGVIARQGYISVQGANFFFPAIAIPTSGAGVMVASYSGANSFPSAAFIPFGSSGPTGPVFVNGSGARPDDGYTCYRAYVGADANAGCRWGDYSAAAAENPAHVVFATEFIPDTATGPFSNWGTLVSRR
jgi:hypothetical protein